MVRAREPPPGRRQPPAPTPRPPRRASSRRPAPLRLRPRRARVFSVLQPSRGEECGRDPKERDRRGRIHGRIPRRERALFRRRRQRNQGGQREVPGRWQLLRQRDLCRGRIGAAAAGLQLKEAVMEWWSGLLDLAVRALPVGAGLVLADGAYLAWQGNEAPPHE